MTDLNPLPLQYYLDVIFSEFPAQQSIFDYPLKKMYLGATGHDLSVIFQGKTAATPIGPAAGPHTQLAQNIVKSFLAGGRIFELKTVQINDTLEIPRPCIDAPNIGFNVEWSQELSLEQSKTEYVKAWILLKALEEKEVLGIAKGNPFYRSIFDLSVGYDLAGIQSEGMTQWITDMMDASTLIQAQLNSLPNRYNWLKKLAIDPHIASSVTLSTFHGCPGNEIEAIVTYLMTRFNLHVFVKLNPTILGFSTVRSILDKLAYQHLKLDPSAFAREPGDENPNSAPTDLSMQEACAMMKRLQKIALQKHLKLGAKFANTLIVFNHRQVFQEQVMYLSGSPLHVLAMKAAEAFRQAMGPEFPLSFAGGVDKTNIAATLACNFQPVTICTDLLKKGGYSRLFSYLQSLIQEMDNYQASTINQYIKAKQPDSSGTVGTAGLANLIQHAATLLDRPEYYAANVLSLPKTVTSQLHLFDCLTCNICLAVCPNSANIELSIPANQTAYHDLEIQGETLKPTTAQLFALEKKWQIANLADFCNECGNCTTFCPEQGAPFLEKPRLFFHRQAFDQDTKNQAFYFCEASDQQQGTVYYRLLGRLDNSQHRLDFFADQQTYEYQVNEHIITLDADHHPIKHVQDKTRISQANKLPMQPYYQMVTLLNHLKQPPAGYPTTMLAYTNRTNLK